LAVPSTKMLLPMRSALSERSLWRVRPQHPDPEFERGRGGCRRNIAPLKPNRDPRATPPSPVWWPMDRPRALSARNKIAYLNSASSIAPRCEIEPVLCISEGRSSKSRVHGYIVGASWIHRPRTLCPITTAAVRALGNDPKCLIWRETSLCRLVVDSESQVHENPRTGG